VWAERVAKERKAFLSGVSQRGLGLATGEYSAPKGELVVTAPIVFGRLHVRPAESGFGPFLPCAVHAAT
jgi:hypothetical protein